MSKANLRAPIDPNGLHDKVGKAIKAPPEIVAICKGEPIERKAETALPLWTLNDLLAYQPDPKEEIWPNGILSMGEPAAIIGAPGIGKSRLALQAAIRTILGLDFLGWETRGQGMKWLFLQTENSARRLKSDLFAMTRHMAEFQREAIQAHLRILNVGAMEFATIAMNEGHPDREQILATLAAWAPDIVPIDPLRDAGVGDPNKDADMMELCKGITSVVRQSNPRRVPLVIHHGRTGAMEASKVFGDDSASFGRNSKVLHGWLRSQINVALAGTEYPGILVVGCGKCSNGPRWEPFAVRLDELTMTYRRLESDEFDLNQWAEGAAVAKKKRNIPSPEEVERVVSDAGGSVLGGEHNSNGLVQRIMRATRATREDAKTAVEAALGKTIIEDAEIRTSHQGGKPVRKYVLNGSKMYEPKDKNGAK